MLTKFCAIAPLIHFQSDFALNKGEFEFAQGSTPMPDLVEIIRQQIKKEQMRQNSKTLTAINQLLTDTL